MLNFKVLRAATKDADKLPNEVQVDCYRISVAPVKACVEEQMKNLQNSLIRSLRKKVTTFQH